MQTVSFLLQTHLIKPRFNVGYRITHSDKDAALYTILLAPLVKSCSDQFGNRCSKVFIASNVNVYLETFKISTTVQTSICKNYNSSNFAASPTTSTPATTTTLGPVPVPSGLTVLSSTATDISLTWIPVNDPSVQEYRVVVQNIHGSHASTQVLMTCDFLGFE